MNPFLLFVLFLAFLVTILLVAIHWGFRAPRHKEHGSPAQAGFAFEQVWIPTVRGRRLFGWVLPATQSDQWVVMLHGWGGNAQMMLPLVRPFHAAGWNALVFDARNHGSSEGHGPSSLPRFAEDVEHVVEWLNEKTSDAKPRIALLGHSVGAGAVLLAASRRRDIAAVISLSAFAHPKWMMRRYLEHRMIPHWVVRMINAYVQWVIGYRFSEIAPVNTACEVVSPVLLVHGQNDRVVPISDAHTIHQNCGHKGVKLLEVPGAGHTSIDKIDQYGAVLVDFLIAAGFEAMAVEPPDLKPALAESSST